LHMLLNETRYERNYLRKKTFPGCPLSDAVSFIRVTNCVSKQDHHE
jgi:hypothetical protein